MKKKQSLPIALIATFCLAIPSYSQSEWTHTGNWKHLLLGKKNPHITDSLVILDFEGGKYQIPYSVEGKHDYFYPKEAGIPNASDGKAIRLYPGSILKLDTFFLKDYDGLTVNVPYAIQHVNQKENIAFTSHKGNNRPNVIEKINWSIPSNDYSCGFPKTFQLNAAKRNPFWNESHTPLDLIIEITESSTPSENGYYCIEQIFLTGNVRTYALFHSPGNWFQQELWTEHRPTHLRNALIQGEVTIDDSARCKEMIACNANIQLVDEGSLQMEKMTTILPFPGKGKWYFVSFPFDVYPENVDSRFIWGDETTQTSSKNGNTFYVHAYDGVRRSEQNATSGNWKLLAPEDIEEGIPLFKKGQGYLIALDAKAKIDSLCFASPDGGNLLFTPSLQIPVEASHSQQGNPEHNGWFLCGNPLPSTLSLQDIQTNPDLDGYIYCYEEGEYKAYPIGSDHVLAPYAAFFVKAKRDTELQIRKSSIDKTASFRSTLQLYSGKDPNQSITSVEAIPPHVSYQIGNGFIHFQDLPQAGTLSIFNIQGKLIREEPIPSGNSRCLLPELPGIYLLQIQAGDWTESIKYRK